MPFFSQDYDGTEFESVPIHFEYDDNNNNQMIPLGCENIPMEYINDNDIDYEDEYYPNNMISFGQYQNPYNEMGPNPYMQNQNPYYNMGPNPYMQNQNPYYGMNQNNMYPPQYGQRINPYISGTLYPEKFSPRDPYIHVSKDDMNYKSMGYEDPYEYLERKYNEFDSRNNMFNSKFIYPGINNCEILGPSEECLKNIPYGYNKNTWRIEAERRALHNKAIYLGFDSIEEYKEAMLKTDISLFKRKCKYHNYTDEEIDNLVKKKFYNEEPSIEDKMQQTLDDYDKQTHSFEVQVILNGEVIIDTKRDGHMGQKEYPDWNRISMIEVERKNRYIDRMNYLYNHSPDRILDKYDNIQDIMDNFYKVNHAYHRMGNTFKDKRDKKLLDRCRYKKKMDYLRILSEYGKLNERIKISKALKAYDKDSDPYNPDYEPLIGWTFNDDCLKRAEDWIAKSKSFLENFDAEDDDNIPKLDSDYKEKFILSANSRGGKIIE